MSNKLFISTIFLILTLGLILNIVVAPFIDTPTIQDDSILSNGINFIAGDWSISILTLTIDLNPLSWVDSVQLFLVEQLTLLTYIPDSILSIIMVMFILSFTLYIIRLIRGN